MFHLHVLGAIQNDWFATYNANHYTSKIMGKWYSLYKRDIRIYLCYVNHPVYPV